MTGLLEKKKMDGKHLISIVSEIIKFVNLQNCEWGFSLIVHRCVEMYPFNNGTGQTIQYLGFLVLCLKRI